MKALHSESKIHMALARPLRGFSLVELLVVIAIVAILLVILLPSLRQARDLAHRTQCASNMKELTQAWLLFANDHQGKLVSGEHKKSKENGMPPWIEKGPSAKDIKRGALFPYIRNIDVYHCPRPPRPYINSYTISATLNANLTHSNPYYGALTLAEIEEPSRTMVFIKEDNINGWVDGSFHVRPHKWIWSDYVSGTHNNGDNLSFADGHVEYWRWEDPDTLDYVYSKSGSKDKGSKDLLRMWGVFDPRSYREDYLKL